MILMRDEIRLCPDFPFQANNIRLWKKDNRKDFYHWHDFCEITLVNRGEGVYFVNGKRFPVQCGDLIIFNNTEPHGWQLSSTHLDVTVLIFSLHFIPELNDDYLKLFIHRGSHFKNKIGQEEGSADKILSAVKEIQEEYTCERQGYRLMVVGGMLRLLTLLSRHYREENSSADVNELFSDKKKSMKRIEEALRYIQEHYTEKISLKIVADKICMSENYFSSYFKKVTNSCFMDYVTELRVQKALGMIQTTGLTRSEIALECGFNNMSNFYKMLKKHGGDSPLQSLS